VSVVSFDAEKTQKADNLIRVLVIEPHRVPYESEIENTLEGQQMARYMERFFEPEEISAEEVEEHCIIRFIPW